MAREFSYTITASAGGTTYSPCYVPDFHQVPFGVSLLVTSNGSAAYTVQHTPSDPWTSNLSIPTNGAWFNHAYIVDGATAQGNYAFPVRGIRMALAAATSGQATLYIIQGEGTGG